MLLASWGESCAALPISTDLVGRPLNESPFFQFALAVNANSPVWISVDPEICPQAILKPVPVFVTVDRTAAEWAADPVLVDVRATGAEVVFFPGGELSQNAVALNVAGLPSVEGSRVGVGYDLIVDADLSGTLTPGDLIDGYDQGPGFALVPNLTLNGLHAVSTANYTVSGPNAGFTAQRAYYPSDIASLGQLPVVLISHGNGHLYTWYDWIGQHLASHGLIVVSHQNETMPGIETASTTTLEHTEAFLLQHGSIAGGVLSGHVDGSQIVWIGHSRGGEGVVRAFDRLVDGQFVSTAFGAEDIALISSMAPTDLLGTSASSPHGAPYHLLYGSADGDVCGCPDSDGGNAFNLYERASGFRASTYVHGADHNDFNCCGTNDFVGPAGTQIGRPEAQRVGKTALRLVIDRVLFANPVASDMLARHYEDLRPIGIAGSTTVVQDRAENPASPIFVIDDFQSNPSTTLSSSGGAVAFNVENLLETAGLDNNSTFTWLSSDPMNGMTRGRPGDSIRALVFDYASPTFIEFALPPGAEDLSEWSWLSFRGAQGTRHPRTTSALGNQTFRVAVVDALGRVSALAIGAYGIGLEEPYQRTGFGSGAGWQNEMELVRIRIRDFTAVNLNLDLSQITAVRFEFGGSGSAPQGRIVLDDIRLSSE